MAGLVCVTVPGSPGDKHSGCVEFLGGEGGDGMAYQYVNTLRSTISAGHLPVDGHPVGDHPLVWRLLRGVRLLVPPEPRYSSFRDVNVVLRMFLSWRANRYLSRKKLTANLLCLVYCRRVSDVRALALFGRIFTP